MRPYCCRVDSLSNITCAQEEEKTQMKKKNAMLQWEQRLSNVSINQGTPRIASNNRSKGKGMRQLFP